MNNLSIDLWSKITFLGYFKSVQKIIHQKQFIKINSCVWSHHNSTLHFFKVTSDIENDRALQRQTFIA